jgi:hypothetical protein
LNHDQSLLCFATRFGEIHVIDLRTLKEINIIPDGEDKARVCGYWLTPDKKAFKASIRTGTEADGRYIWESRVLPLP